MLGIKTFIIILVIMGVLFVVSIGFNLSDSGSGNGDAADYTDNPALQALGSIAGMFGPKLSLNRVSVLKPPLGATRCQVKANQVKLSSFCELKFAASKEKYEKARLTVPKEFQVKVYDEKKCKSRPAIVAGDAVLVTYVSGDEDYPAEVLRKEKNPDSPCWVPRDGGEVSLVILGDGGRLRINCPACAGKNRKLTAVFE